MDLGLKRIIDLLCSLLALIVFAPIMIIAAIAIVINDPGPIFFRQSRLGKGAKPFRIFKFRSMKVNAPDVRNADGSAYSGENDPRVTSVGRFIRKTSIDELPQFINVLIGEMSMVGPRPDQENQLQYYTEEEMPKLSVKPGITGLAQINGRNSISWEERKKLDVQYANTRNTVMDISIMLKTIPYVFFGKDINTNKKP